MKSERDVLARIDGMREPRHFFVVPRWANSTMLDHLMAEGYLTCVHHQRDEEGSINLAMGLQLSPKGQRLIHPRFEWKALALKGSLAGASFAVMSVVILYLG
jgi:hypothetical protein